MIELSPADSAAVVTQVQGFVGPAVQSWLASTFKGLSPEIIGTLSKLATTGAVIASLTVVRWTFIGFAKASRVGRDIVAPLWDRYRGVLNPLLALILGHLDGSALAGALATAIHAGYRGAAKAVAKTTPQDVSRAARVGAIVLALALGASAASADVAGLLRPITQQDRPVSAFARERFAVSFSLGQRWQGSPLSRGSQAFVEAQASYSLTNALGLRAGVRRHAVAEAPLEPEVRLVLVIAP